jgi:hypothetical protein
MHCYCYYILYPCLCIVIVIIFCFIILYLSLLITIIIICLSYNLSWLREVKLCIVAVLPSWNKEINLLAYLCHHFDSFTVTAITCLLMSSLWQFYRRRHYLLIYVITLTVLPSTPWLAYLCHHFDSFTVAVITCLLMSSLWQFYRHRHDLVYRRRHDLVTYVITLTVLPSPPWLGYLCHHFDSFTVAAMTWFLMSSLWQFYRRRHDLVTYVITLTVLPSPPWLGLPLRSISVTNDHGDVLVVVISNRFFPHSRFIVRFNFQTHIRVY